MDINITLIKNSKCHVYVNEYEKLLYVKLLDKTYKKEEFFECLDYIKNFWILTSYGNKIYGQVFICYDVDVYPFEFFDLFIKTLKGLEHIFKKNLKASCLINQSTAIKVLKPVLNVYQAVRPFKFFEDLEEGITFVNSQIIE